RTVGREVFRGPEVGRLYPRGCPRAAGGLPDPPGESHSEPVRGYGHERAHSTRGPGAGYGTAPRARGAGKSRVGSGGLGKGRGGNWQVTPGAGAQGAPDWGSAYAHRV